MGVSFWEGSCGLDFGVRGVRLRGVGLDWGVGGEEGEASFVVASMFAVELACVFRPGSTVSNSGGGDGE